MQKQPYASQLQVRDLHVFTHDTLLALVVVAGVAWVATVFGLVLHIHGVMDGIYGQRSIVYMFIASLLLALNVGVVAVLVYWTPAVIGGYLYRYVVDHIRHDHPPLGVSWGVQMQCCPGLPGWLRGRTIVDDVGLCELTGPGLRVRGDSLTLDLAFDDIVAVRCESYILGLLGTRTILDTRGPCGQRSICLWECTGFTIVQARRRNAALHDTILRALGAYRAGGVIGGYEALHRARVAA